MKLAATPDIVEPLMALFLARDGEWVMWNDAGYYDSSSTGAQYIGWHVNNFRNEPASFYTSDQFQQSLYQPTVVKETFRLRDSRSAAKAVLGKELVSEDLNLAVPLASESQASRYVPPEVNIITPSRNSLVRNGRVSVSFRVKIPRDVEVRDARIYIDGRLHPTPLAASRSGLAGEHREVWFEEDFNLLGGSHVCKVTLETSVDTSASREVRFEVQDAALTRVPPAIDGRLIVLAVGISKYSSPEFSLQFADRDAEKFAASWSIQGKHAFSQVETKLLVNEDASASSIKEHGFDWVLNQDLSSRDTVIVLFAGHGLFDRYNEWYFGGHELNPKRLSVTGISNAELTAFFRKLPTNCIMFLDTCHAGQFQIPKEVSRLSRTGKNPWRGEGKIVFSSCLAGESSLESRRWQHGAFTKAILDYFIDPKADYNGNGELGCLEMVQYVQDHVRSMTNDEQNPAVEFPPGISDVSFGPVAVAGRK